MIDLGGLTYLAGGVTCNGTDFEQQSCQRIDKVHELRFDDHPVYQKPWMAQWTESAAKLKQPKSSHSVLKVPASYCNRLH